MAVADYSSLIDEAAREWDIDPTWVKAVMHQETGGNRFDRQGRPITSGAGAGGLMQIMPGTARDLGVADPHDPVQAIFGGAKYLRQMLDKYGDVTMATAAYNAGPGKVDAVRSGRARFEPETAGYVPAVASHYRMFAGRDASPVKSAKTEVAGESVDDFLKRTAAPEGAPGQPESVDAFLKRTGAVDEAPALPATDPGLMGGAGDTTTPAGALGPPAEMSHWEASDAAQRGIRAGAGMAGNALASIPGAIGRIAGGAGRGAAEGFGAGPSISNQVVNKLAPGIRAPAALAMLPVDAVELALRAGSGLFRGAQGAVAQAGAEVGQPVLGRDLAAIPEAFMGAPNMLSVGVPRGAPANRLAPVADIARDIVAPSPIPTRGVPGAPEFIPPNTSPPPSLARIRELIEADNRLAANRPAEIPPTRVIDPITGAVTPIEQPRNPPDTNAAATPPPDMSGAARSVGAAASATTEANMSPKETGVYRAVAERQKLLEPQPAGADPTLYVEGVNPTLAHIEQSANISREAKMLESAIPEEAKAVAKAHNEARLDHVARLAGSDVDIMNAKAARDAQAQRDLAAAWRNKGHADVSPVIETAATIKASPDGRRPIVRGAVDSVVAELHGPDGKPLTDPEQLYGVRKHIDDLLSKEAGRDDAKSQRAAANLMEMKGSLDRVIEAAAPGFRQYLDNFSAASRPIDAMKVLQSHEPKLIDAQGRIQLSRVQTMMRQITEARKSEDPISPYKSIPDETMAQLWALRDDLRRAASSEELARAKGSDTVQNSMDILKSVAKGTGTGIAHAAVAGAAHAVAPIVGPLVMNPLLNKLATHFQTKKMAARANELLHPDPSRYRPLNPPE